MSYVLTQTCHFYLQGFLLHMSDLLVNTRCWRVNKQFHLVTRWLSELNVMSYDLKRVDFWRIFQLFKQPQKLFNLLELFKSLKLHWKLNMKLRCNSMLLSDRIRFGSLFAFAEFPEKTPLVTLMHFLKPYQRNNPRVLCGWIPFVLCICNHITPGKDSCSNFKGNL